MSDSPKLIPGDYDDALVGTAKYVEMLKAAFDCPDAWCPCPCPYCAIDEPYVKHPCEHGAGLWLAA